MICQLHGYFEIFFCFGLVVPPLMGQYKALTASELLILKSVLHAASHCAVRDRGDSASKPCISQTINYLTSESVFWSLYCSFVHFNSPDQSEYSNVLQDALVRQIQSFASVRLSSHGLYRVTSALCKSDIIMFASQFICENV